MCQMCFTLLYTLFSLFKAPPRIQLAPGPTYAKKGKNITLPKCHVTGFPPPVVTWRKQTPGSLYNHRTLQDGKLLTVRLADKRDIGSYVCHAKNALGETLAVTSLVVLSLPKFITRPPLTVTKIKGSDVSLSCSATGDPSPIISWKRSKGAWEGERMKVNRGKLTISSLSEADSGIYICDAKVSFYTIEARTNLLVINRK